LAAAFLALGASATGAAAATAGAATTGAAASFFATFFAPVALAGLVEVFIFISVAEEEVEDILRTADHTTSRERQILCDAFDFEGVTALPGAFFLKKSRPTTGT
jgi:hypothetical protein